MRKFLKILVLFSIFFSQACKKDTEPLNFKTDIRITNLICYQNDSISMTFLITSTGGKSPYIYNWINPDSLTGEGPFTINIQNNIILEVETIDANQNKIKFQYEIKKDTIDPLKYDYRNAFIGFYDCEVKHRWAEDSSGTYITHQNIYQDTIEVTKNSDFGMLNISDQHDLVFNYRDSTFSGYHAYGEFQNDSITFYYYFTPVGLVNYTYKGKKIK